MVLVLEPRSPPSGGDVVELLARSHLGSIWFLAKAGLVGKLSVRHDNVAAMAAVERRTVPTWRLILTAARSFGDLLLTVRRGSIVRVACLAILCEICSLISD